MSLLPSRVFAASCVIIALSLSSCRLQPNEVTERVITQEVTRIVSEIVTVAATPVEVTRVVEEIVEVTPVPSASPPIQATKSLTICMVNEPPSLYLYDSPLFGVPFLAKQAVLHAVYENLYTTLSFEYQPQAVEKLPNASDGDAEIGSILVNTGDLVLDANGEVVDLAAGVTIIDADGNELVFDGTPVNMSQLVARFTMKPMVWSDGVPVTAADSVFSFEVASQPLTPGDKSLIDRTAAYEAIGELTLQWTGLPGFLDPTYFTNIWAPLPAHQLGHYSPLELTQAHETTEFPLSSGPFAIREWVPGSHISMIKNEHYYRAGEGLPKLDELTYKFVQNANQLMALLLAGQCDIGAQDGVDITQSSLLLEAESNNLITPYFQINHVFEHIDFGINPVASYENSRPDWFEDVRVRQAMIMCTDRQAMVDNILLGRSEVAHAYIPTIHPLYPEDATRWPYDPDTANALLDQAGYLDRNDDGTRQDPETKQAFQVELGINLGNEMRQQIAQMFQGNMTDCGIEVELVPHSAAEWFAPEGPLFGRRFDLAQFPWITSMLPDCDLYTSDSIPTRANGWLGNNETGWSDPAYDAACKSARLALFGSETSMSQHQEAIRIFTEQLPVIPLFSHLKLAVTQPNVRNFALDPSQDSEFWNLFEIDLILEETNAN